MSTDWLPADREGRLEGGGLGAADGHEGGAL